MVIYLYLGHAAPREESRFTDMNDEHVRKTTGKPPFYGPMDKEAVSNAMDG